MSPAKGRGVVDVASFCGLGDADTVDHGCGLCRPLVLHAQPGQRGFRQGIEGTLTGFATVAQQSARLAPMHDIAAGAMRATEAVHAALPKFSNNIASKPVQRLRQRRWRCDRRLVERYRRTAGGNVHAPRRTGLDVIATRSLGQGQRPPSLAPLRRRQCRDPAQPAVKLRHVHGGLLASQVSAIADTNNQRHESHRETLRDIEACLSAQAHKLYHIGFRQPVHRSTLADANEARDWRIYAAFAQRLIAQARRLYAGDSLGADLKEAVYALDSTTIDLCLSVFPWAHFRTSKAAVKMHTLLDLRGNIPSFIHVSNGKMHDVRVLDMLVPE